MTNKRDYRNLWYKIELWQHVRHSSQDTTPVKHSIKISEESKYGMGRVEQQDKHQHYFDTIEYQIPLTVKNHANEPENYEEWLTQQLYPSFICTINGNVVHVWHELKLRVGNDECADIEITDKAAESFLIVLYNKQD